MNNINTIAQACYKDGGRSVYMARNFSLRKLNKYYTDENCTPPPPVAPIQSANSSNGNVSISPNPSDYEIKIGLDESWSNSNVSITIVDATGKIVLKKMTDLEGDLMESINVKSLPSGLYIVRINNEKQSQTKKIVIKH